MNLEIEKMLANSNTLIDGSHFVYKAGTHGPTYINKEEFAFIGSDNLTWLLREVAFNATGKGIDFGDNSKVGIIGPAYGAIAFVLTIAHALERQYGGQYIFFPARTELVVNKTGKKIHTIPEKLHPAYRGKAFVIAEDIVNNGTTIREVKKIFEREVNGRIIGVLSIVDRGGQTADSLEVPQYFPLIRIKMKQYDVRKEKCPLCDEGKPINILLGKGKRWVKMFGQPPYPKNTDFSAFWK